MVANGTAPLPLSAAAKALSRMAARGVIKRYKKGMYYKPKQTIFGEIKPSEEELLKSYLFENHSS